MQYEVGMPVGLAAFLFFWGNQESSSNGSVRIALKQVILRREEQLIVTLQNQYTLLVFREKKISVPLPPKIKHLLFWYTVHSWVLVASFSLFQHRKVRSVSSSGVFRGLHRSRCTLVNGTPNDQEWTVVRQSMFSYAENHHIRVRQFCSFVWLGRDVEREHSWKPTFITDLKIIHESLVWC